MRKKNNPPARTVENGIVMRGKNVAQGFIEQFSADEMADALIGFRQAVTEHLAAQRAKMEAILALIEEAESKI